MRPTKLAFEERYSDDSGIEFAVRYDAAEADDEIEFHHINQVGFPLSRLSWLIGALQRIQSETTASDESSPEGVK